MDIAAQVRDTFIQSLALCVKEGFDTEQEYRRGWLDGYAQAWHQMTGETIWQLIDHVNEILRGSGKSLSR